MLLTAALFAPLAGAVLVAAVPAARSGRRLQSGLVRNYALGVLGGAVLIVAFLVFRP